MSSTNKRSTKAVATFKKDTNLSLKYSDGQDCQADVDWQRSCKIKNKIFYSEVFFYKRGAKALSFCLTVVSHHCCVKQDRF